MFHTSMIARTQTDVKNVHDSDASLSCPSPEWRGFPCGVQRKGRGLG